MGNIGGRGQGKERVGRGKRPQGPVGGGGGEEQREGDGDRGDTRGARQGDREDESEGWSIKSDAAFDEETEEDRMPAGEQEGSKDTLTASSWGTQESGSGGIQVDTQAGRRDERKAPSVTADETDTWGRRGARQGQGENDGGRREKVGAEPLGVEGNNGGQEASGVDPEYHGVGEGERGREASRVAEKIGGVGALR